MMSMVQYLLNVTRDQTMLLDIVAHVFATLFGAILFFVVMYKVSGFFLRIIFVLLGKEVWFNQMWAKPVNWLYRKGFINYNNSYRYSDSIVPSRDDFAQRSNRDDYFAHHTSQTYSHLPNNIHHDNRH